MDFFSNSLPIAGSIILCFLSAIEPANSQIASDGTLSTNVTTTDNLNFTINGGNRSGINLFHSFRDFSVPTGGEAFFNNVSDIQNIFSRVTGSSISNIDGLIRANGTANLFLLNPNGIIFGPNARLNIGGSFVASTASSLRFADGTFFSATDSQSTPLLTISVPIGLQYRANPGRILVQGNGRGLRTNDDIIDITNGLRVEPNQTLALVGGEVVLQGGTLKTAGGRIELGSVAGEGLVSLTPVEKGFSLNYEGVPSFGDIQLSDATAVDASGVGGGDIQVRGRRVTLTGGSQIESTTLRSGAGGKLSVIASELVELIGSTADNRRRPSSISTDNRQASAIPAELSITTGRLIVRDGARVSASNARTGRGGNINIYASDSVELIGTGIGPAGQRSSALSVQTRGAGDAGNLTITTRHLIVRDGAEVTASSFGGGNGGSVQVNASEKVELIGTSTPSANGQPLRSRIIAEVSDPKDTPREGGSSPTVAATGRGGGVTLKTELLTIRDGAVVTVSNTSTDSNAKDAGNLDVTAQTIRLDNQGAIAATTTSGAGGDITLQASNLILLRGNSQITTTAGTQQTGGNGGNITIDTANLVALENSDITANAFQGRGGQVNIEAQGIFGAKPRSREQLQTLLNADQPNSLNPGLLPSSDITAISQQGEPQLQGTVQINRPDVEPSTGLVDLPENVVDVTALIDQKCSPQARQSRFIITGRGGLPPSPNQPLSDEAYLVNLVTLNPGEQGNRGAKEPVGRLRRERSAER